MRFHGKSILLPTLAAACLMLMSALLVLGSGPAIAHPDDNPENGVPLDFITGGGWIMRATGFKANFGVGGGVKNGDWWGHLNYIDHGDGLHVKDKSITAYLFIDDRTRDICGRADTNHFGEVAFHVRVTDNGEPGRDDIFIIRLGQNGTIVYTTEFDPDHTLGGAGPGGGNIQLHKGNRSNTAPSTSPVCEI